MLSKKLTLILLLFACLQASAQKIQVLTDVGAGEPLRPGDAIIYSVFTPPNLNWGTGMAYMAIYNVDTKKYSYIQLMPYNTMKSKNFPLCYHIIPGTYQLAFLIWSDYHIAYFRNRSGLIHKNSSYTDSAANRVNEVLNGRITDTANRYTFTIKADTLYYLGNWDASNGVIKITNNRTDADKRLKKDYYILSFDEAVTELPE
jgi:hypothetical protein